MEKKILTLPYEKNRNYITTILNQHNLHGIGVEIGVKKGAFSEILLKNWNCKQLYLVDPWCIQDEKIYDEKIHDHNQDIIDCKINLEKYKDKYTIIQEFSNTAYKYFKDESIDFIYIDGNHSYEGVQEDLMLWYPKLVKNGIIAGDDYTIESIENPFNSEFGVKKAVDEFALKHKKNISIELTGEWYYIHNDNYIPSRNWYFIK